MKQENSRQACRHEDFICISDKVGFPTCTYLSTIAMTLIWLIPRQVEGGKRMINIYQIGERKALG